MRIIKTGAKYLGLLGVLAMGYGFLAEPRRIQVEKVSLRLKRLTPAFYGIRIVQISDIHMGGWMNTERLQRVVNLIAAQKADILLLTGDFLPHHGFYDSDYRSLREMQKIFSPLARNMPSFAVLGNHDYWTSATEVRRMLRDSCIIDVTNTVFTITRGEENLHICGVDDVWAGEVRLDKVLEKLQDDSAAILLAHEPDYADISARTGRFDLQVSGHTHGGQVSAPIFGPPVLPPLGGKYPSGLYRVGEMYQYTNRGVGMNWIPIRFNCPAEITVFTLCGTEYQG